MAKNRRNSLNKCVWIHRVDSMFKTLLAAAAVTFAFVGAGSAATLTPGPGSNAIIADESYDYFSTGVASNAAGSLVFNLDVAPADAPIFAEAAVSTLELSSDFVGLTVTLTNVSGTTAIAPTTTSASGSIYDMSTLFDSGDLSQTITISWTGVTDVRPSGRAFVNLSIITSAAPIPLPAGGLLLISALGGVAALRRRRKQAA